MEKTPIKAFSVKNKIVILRGKIMQDINDYVIYENTLMIREPKVIAKIKICGGGLTFTIGGTSITLTALAIAAIAGILLNAILPGNDYEFGKNPAGDSSRGVYVMNTDSEKEESEDNK